MARGRPKRKFKKSSNSEISPKLGKSDMRRALDEAKHIEERHGDKGLDQQGHSEGGSDEQEASETRPGEQELRCAEQGIGECSKEREEECSEGGLSDQGGSEEGGGDKGWGEGLINSTNTKNPAYRRH